MTMTEFRDLSLNLENVNERDGDAVVPDDFPNQLPLDVIQNLELSENALEHMDHRRLQQENNLFILTLVLKDVTICLLELQLKLLEIKQEKFKIEIKSCMEDLNSVILNLQNVSNHIKNDSAYNQLQEKLELLIIVQKKLEECTAELHGCKDDEDKFLDEMHGYFSKYQEAYKKCMVYIENFLQKVKNKFKISNVPRESQEELCVLFSVLEENVDSYHKIILSSRKKFENFGLIFKKYMELSSQDSDNRINLSVAAIKIAELSYIKLKPILFEIINFDCAIRGQF